MHKQQRFSDTPSISGYNRRIAELNRRSFAAIDFFLAFLWEPHYNTPDYIVKRHEGERGL